MCVKFFDSYSTRNDAYSYFKMDSILRVMSHFSHCFYCKSHKNASAVDWPIWKMLVQWAITCATYWWPPLYALLEVPYALLPLAKPLVFAWKWLKKARKWPKMAVFRCFLLIFRHFLRKTVNFLQKLLSFSKKLLSFCEKLLSFCQLSCK